MTFPNFSSRNFALFSLSGRQYSSSPRDPENVASVSIGYNIMALQWELIHDLRGRFSGSPSTDMRSKTTTWLAKEKREQENIRSCFSRNHFALHALAASTRDCPPI